MKKVQLDELAPQQVRGDRAKPKIIRRAALSLLARRDYTARDLKQKLKMKGYPINDIDVVVTEFVAAGLMNDTRFAENYLYARRGKGYGPVRISIELQNAGIANNVIAELIDITDNAWFNEARKVWQKHFKGKRSTDYKDQAKQMRFLQYRGFTREHIDNIFKE